jgi:hypothetical protein
LLDWGAETVEGMRLQQAQLDDFCATKVVLVLEQQSSARMKQHQPCGIETAMIKMSRMIVCNFTALS